jgi:4-hydroxy-tetrahydrodipicolinate synthase
MPMPVEGVLTALVTPFRDDALDVDAVRRLVAEQAEAGVAGVIVCGAAGEGFALTPSERSRIVAAAVTAAAGRLPIVAEVGTNATAHSIEHARRAVDAGASAIVLPTPYYNKPSPDGVFRHVEAVLDALACPVLLANGAERSGIEIAPALLRRFAAEGRLAGYIETSGRMERLAAVRRALGSAAPLWIGNDSVFVHCPTFPSQGFVSTVAVLVPDACARLARTRQGDPVLADLVDRLEDAGDPGLVKHMLAALDPRLGAGVRLPLLPLAPRLRAEADALAGLARTLLAEAGASTRHRTATS